MTPQRLFFDWAWSRIRETAPDLPEKDSTVVLSVGTRKPADGYEAHLRWPNRGINATGVGATLEEAVDNLTKAFG